MPKRDYLFVYGTLRKGMFSPVGALLRHHSEFVGKATFRGKLYDLGGYPGAVPSDRPSDTVKGELYLIREIDRVLRDLDQYEGCGPAQPPPTEFRRQRVVVHLESTGKKVEPHGLTPVAPSTRFVGRNPPKRILLRQVYGGYPPRIHPRVYTRGFLRRRVKAWIYLYNRSEAGLRPIRSGDYLESRKGRR